MDEPTSYQAFRDLIFSALDNCQFQDVIDLITSHADQFELEGYKAAVIACDAILSYGTPEEGLTVEIKEQLTDLKATYSDKIKQVDTFSHASLFALTKYIKETGSAEEVAERPPSPPV